MGEEFPLLQVKKGSEEDTMKSKAREGNRTTKSKTAVVHRHDTTNKIVEEGRGDTPPDRCELKIRAYRIWRLCSGSWTV
eukprot:4436104-Ditylum_brightwellii.AAC.1